MTTEPKRSKRIYTFPKVSRSFRSRTPSRTSRWPSRIVRSQRTITRSWFVRSRPEDRSSPRAQTCLATLHCLLFGTPKTRNRIQCKSAVTLIYGLEGPASHQRALCFQPTFGGKQIDCHLLWAFYHHIWKRELFCDTSC